jgi:hypothetical protein
MSASQRIKDQAGSFAHRKVVAFQLPATRRNKSSRFRVFGSGLLGEPSKGH